MPSAAAALEPSFGDGDRSHRFRYRRHGQSCFSMAVAVPTGRAFRSAPEMGTDSQMRGELWIAEMRFVGRTGPARQRHCPLQ